jgi:Tol biopolymer transport system component
MTNEDRFPGSGFLGSQRPTLLLSRALLALGSALSACTLTSDSFEPALVPGDETPAPAPPLEESSVPLNEDEGATGRTCTGEGGEGIRFNGDDPSCESAVGLLPSAERGEPDAGSIVQSSAPIALPPCEGELGAFEAPEPVTGLDFDENVFGPALSADGRTLYFSAYVSGEQQIYSASRDRRGRAFEGVRELPVVNSPASDGSPFLSSDGERLYLFSERTGGIGQRDVWISRRQSDGARFAEPQLLAGINSRATELLPWLSADELTLIFVSDRGGGRGGADLWLARRDAVDADFDEPTNLAELSSGENEGRAVLSADGLSAFFSSDRSGGRGGPDLWMAIRAQREQPFVVLLNLAPLNSTESDQDVALSSDGTELFFASSRGGVSQLWRAARSCQ